jgi:dihydroorotate dehydrogenase electron transfer subunit
MRRVRAEILNARKAGALQSVTLVAPEIAERARPGQFVSVATPPDRRSVLRSHFFIHQASRRGGWAGTLEFVFDPERSGSDWLASAKAHEFLDVIGPLGKPFAFPRAPNACLLIAEGPSASCILFLAQELRSRGKRVDIVLAAPDESRVFKPIEAKRLAQTIAVVTADGSLGERGPTAAVVARVAQDVGTEVIYAAGPRRLLREVSEFCTERQIPSQIAIDEEMACGTGLCFTCVVPVIRKDGSGYDNLRACVDGPVFNPARVFWSRWTGDEIRAVPTPPQGFPPLVGSWPA